MTKKKSKMKEQEELPDLMGHFNRKALIYKECQVTLKKTKIRQGAVAHAHNLTTFGG